MNQRGRVERLEHRSGLSGTTVVVRLALLDGAPFSLFLCRPQSNGIEFGSKDEFTHWAAEKGGLDPQELDSINEFMGW